jgi:hypothetical protein
MKIKIIFFLLVLFLFGQKIPAQNLYQNQCLVQLDKAFYVSGELIWFKVFLPTSFKGKTFNLKAGILDKNGRLLESFFLSNGGKTFAEGHYKIPFNAESGQYQLMLGALNTQSKQLEVFAKVLVPIYNDLDKVDESKIKLESAASTNPFPNDLQVSIELEKPNYHSREEVKAKVVVKDRNGQPVAANLSIAVNDGSLVGNSENEEGLNANFQNVPSQANFSNQLFEQVKVQESGTQQGQNLIAIFYPHNWLMQYTPSSAAPLWVEAPNFSGEKSMQLLGYPNPNIAVEKLNVFPSSPSPELEYNRAVLDYLELSRQRKKIYQLYGALETQLPPLKVVKDSLPLAPDRSWRPEVYEKFEDLAVWFREVSTPLSFKQERKTGRFNAKMYNPNDFVDYPGEPIFLINGKITRDADFVARLKTNQIDQVDLYYRPETLYGYFKTVGRSGVANLVLKADINVPAKDAATVLPINGLQTSTAFPVTKNDANMPVFRPQLYWNARLETNAQGEASFSFPQSDDWSRFRIQVIAQGESGVLGAGSKVYEVGGK